MFRVDKHCIVLLFLFFSFSYFNLNDLAFAQKITQVPATFIVSVHTDNVKYVAGTPIRISGEVFTTSSSTSAENVTIYKATIYKSIPVIITTTAHLYTGFLGGCNFGGCITPSFENSNSTISTTAAVARDGSYDVLLAPISRPGFYQITANVSPESGALSLPTSISIEIQDLFYTRTFLLLYVGLGTGLIGLTFVILKAPKGPEPRTSQPKGASEATGETDEKIRFSLSQFALSHNTYALLRFLFLSVIATTLMIAFALTDVQIAPLSPFGLVIKTTGGNNTMTSNQWVVNIGGIVSNNYSSGVQVPVSVIIFGIAGGYLRFLYFTSTKGLEQREEQWKRQQEEPFYDTLKDLALFFLSPLLAVAVWLVLFQSGTTSILTLAAVSFTVGLVTREVVEALIKFVTSKVSTRPSDIRDEKIQK